MRIRGGRWPRLVLQAVLAAGAALAALPLASSSVYTVGPGQIRLHARPALPGTTVIALPPLGNAAARTHSSPLRLTISPETIDVPDLRRLLERRPTPNRLVRDLEGERNRALARFGLRLVGIGAAAGLLAFGVLRSRRRMEALVALAAGALAPALLYGWALLGFRPAAFREPALSGALALAPEVVGSIEQLEERFGAFRRQLDVLGTSAFKIYQFLAEQSAVPDDAVRVLHISDLHLNPVGYDVALQVARQFKVSAVFDTGDLTAEGSEVETAFAERIREFAVSYVFVRGNHDSPATQAAVARNPNAIVLDGEARKIAGLIVFGMGDPLFTPGRGGERDTDEQREAKLAFAAEVAGRLEASGADPDVVLVHDRTIANELLGEVRVILAGHGHRWLAREQEGTLTLAVGSTGAAGLYTLNPDSNEQIALQVLYFEPATGDLIAYDRIEVRGPRNDFSLRRTVVQPGRRVEASATPQPVVRARG